MLFFIDLLAFALGSPRDCNCQPCSSKPQHPNWLSGVCRVIWSGRNLRSDLSQPPSFLTLSRWSVLLLVGLRGEKSHRFGFTLLGSLIPGPLRGVLLACASHVRLPRYNPLSKVGVYGGRQRCYLEKKYCRSGDRIHHMDSQRCVLYPG